jgi:alkylation response protein AidB-like acyl-CoA dehydrogenase
LSALAMIRAAIRASVKASRACFGAYSLGMRGTDTNDVAVDGVFVPAARTFVVGPEFEPGRHYGGPL